MRPLALLSSWALAAAALVTSSALIHDRKSVHGDGEWPTSVPHHQPPHVNGKPSTPVHDHNPAHGDEVWHPPIHDHSPIRRAPAKMSVRMVHQFANNTWIENLAVRPNGHVLVTLMTTPDLYSIDPVNHKSSLVHCFSNHLGLLGIAELEPDVFYVIAENYSQPTNTNTPGAGSVYRVDMYGQHPKVTLAANFPNSNLLNGIAALSVNDSLLLVGDAGAGEVYSLNSRTGETKVVMNDQIMKPPKGAPVGIDGLQIHNNTLYFTNAPFGTFVSIPLNANGTAAGPPTTHLQNLEVDDFTINANGHAYMSVFYSDQIARYRIGDHNATMVAGPSKMLSGPTSCKFGRTAADNKVLYVSTNGGLGIADGSKTPGGTLSMINMAPMGEL